MSDEDFLLTGVISIPLELFDSPPMLRFLSPSISLLLCSLEAYRTDLAADFKDMPPRSEFIVADLDRMCSDTGPRDDSEGAIDASIDFRFDGPESFFRSTGAGTVTLSMSSVSTSGNGRIAEKKVGVSFSPFCEDVSRWLFFLGGPFRCMRAAYIRVLVVDFNERLFLV